MMERFKTNSCVCRRFIFIKISGYPSFGNSKSRGYSAEEDLL